jgi:hypothetical protein
MLWRASISTTPGWARSGGSGLAGITFLGPTSVQYSGWARPGFPRPKPDYLFLGRFSPLRARIYLLQDILFIRHRLQRLVPVLGCPLAQTGTSSIIVCWSWDAPWLRPAYSTSPSQSYPQEEDKTDDMEILKTHARRRRPRTPSTDIDGTSP